MNDLIIPVYLNQRIVFDMVAMLQNGMSTIAKVTEKTESKGADERNYGTAFGLSKALSGLFKIDIHGARNLAETHGTEVKRTEEKVHTPASLFQMLRVNLFDSKKIQEITSDISLEPGMMVEFSTMLSQNPVNHTLGTFIGLIDMICELSQQSNKKGHTSSQNQQLQNVRKQISSFLNTANSGETTDLVSAIHLPTKHKVVITPEKEFLNDPKMSDLVDGELKVVGKIIRVISNDSSSLNLLRKETVGALNPEILDQFFSALSAAAEQGNITVPDITYEIKGPVIQVLPVAVFA